MLLSSIVEVSFKQAISRALCQLTVSFEFQSRSERNTVKYCKCNSLRVTTDLLNSEKLKIAIAQLCNELQVCNSTML